MPPPLPNQPRTVLDAKRVELALITYVNDAGQQVTQLGVVGENNIHLLESRSLGISREPTPQGTVQGTWLKDGIFQKLGKK